MVTVALTADPEWTGSRNNPAVQDMRMMFEGLSLDDVTELPGIFIGLCVMLVNKVAVANHIDPEELWAEFSTQLTNAVTRDN
jgi:hypothetical protein